MTIRDYFAMILDAQGWDAYMQAEAEAWGAYVADDDGEAWDAWLTAHPQVDALAMEGDEYSITWWAWDMCGD